ncbi:MAG: PKD domain-containing protein, partial [Microthrixaceae bacterium]
AAPVPVVTINPPVGDIGTTFTLDGGASVDPDGTIAAIDWIVTYPDGTPVTASGAVVQVTPPATAVGISSVMVIATDTQGKEGTEFSQFTLVDPTAPTTTTPGSETTLPPTDPGVLVASFSDVAAPGASRAFDAAPTTGIGTGATASYAWSFGDGLTGTGPSPTHEFPNNGNYLVALTVMTSDGRSSSTSRTVNVGGAPPAPTNVRHDGTNVLWNAVPGARRYLVDFEFRTATDCYLQITNQNVGAVPNPSKAIPANPCPASATARARVGTDANGAISWSGWIEVPALGTVAPPVTAPAPEVVK